MPKGKKIGISAPLSFILARVFKNPLIPNTLALLAVPHPGDLGMPHLLLKLEDTKHEGLGGRRATRNVDIHRHDPVTAAGDAVRVVVVAAAVCARAHGDDPAGVGHLVVDLAQGGGHFVGEGAGHDHDVRLAGRGAENDAHAILVVAGGAEVHHLDGAAGEAEGHGPEGALAGPVCDLVERGSEGGLVWVLLWVWGFGCWHVQCVLHGALLALLAGQRHLSVVLSGNGLHGRWGARVALDEGGPLHCCCWLGR